MICNRGDQPAVLVGLYARRKPSRDQQSRIGAVVKTEKSVGTWDDESWSAECSVMNQRYRSVYPSGAVFPEITPVKIAKMSREVYVSNVSNVYAHNLLMPNVTAATLRGLIDIGRAGPKWYQCRIRVPIALVVAAQTLASIRDRV